MKNFKWKILIAITMLLSADKIMAQGGIKFEKSPWEKVLKKAKKQGKNIMVDCYTTWCGPCKLMDKKTFMNPNVAAFYNEHYINFKIDMETPEGKALNEYFYVSVYPTLLFLDSAGNTLNKATGYYGSSAFLEMGKKALTYPIEKKYSKVNLVQERKKESDFQKNKYFEMTRNAGFDIARRDWKTTLADAKAIGKNVMVIFGDTYRPLHKKLVAKESIEYLSENFEVTVVSLLNSYLKDKDGEIIKDKEGNLLQNEWMQKYNPSVYPGVVFINSDGDKLIDGGQSDALTIGKMVQQGVFKPQVGFWESVKVAGWDLADGKKMDQVLLRAKNENKCVMIVWYGATRDLHPAFADEEVRKKCYEQFVPIAINNKAHPALGKKYRYGGASSISFINQKGELLNAYSLPLTASKQDLLQLLANAKKTAQPKALPAKATGMQQITPIEN